MSETLRDLVVSLSLQTDNFTRNIKSVSKQIAEAESQFKLAAAGVEGFERTATGLATQLSTLERRLSLQKDAVNQYQRALEAANNKLSECYNRQNDYAQRLEAAKAAQQALKEQVAAAAQICVDSGRQVTGELRQNLRFRQQEDDHGGQNAHYGHDHAHPHVGDGGGQGFAGLRVLLCRCAENGGCHRGRVCLSGGFIQEDVH